MRRQLCARFTATLISNLITQCVFNSYSFNYKSDYSPRSSRRFYSILRQCWNSLKKSGMRMFSFLTEWLQQLPQVFSWKFILMPERLWFKKSFLICFIWRNICYSVSYLLSNSIIRQRVVWPINVNKKFPLFALYRWWK